MVAKSLRNLSAGILVGLASSQSAKSALYDDFSSGVLDTTKWTISQDIENQQLTDEYGVDSELKNFHTRQIQIGDRRTYLKPTREFNAGETLTYQATYLSGMGNNGHIILVNNRVTPNRHGIFGFNNSPQPYQDGFGTYNIQLNFLQNGVNISGQGPNGLVWYDQPMNQSESAPYTLYIGSFSGHNGNTHIDLDNFHITHEPSSLEILGPGIATLARRRST